MGVSLLYRLSLLFVSALCLQSGFAQDFSRWGLPEGARARIGKGGVSEIDYSPDAALLAVATSIGIWLYDPHSGREVALLKGHAGPVTTVTFSPDGRTLASGSEDGTIRLWEVHTRKLLRVLKSHPYKVNSVAFSPDGELLASGDWQGAMRLWDARTGVIRQVLDGHAKAVNSVVFSPDGLTLASGSDDTTIRLWQVQNGKHLKTFEGHKGSVNSVAYSPDGTRLASGGMPASLSAMPDGLHLWDARTGEHLQILGRFTNGMYDGHVFGVNSVEFSPDGKTLASGSDDATIRLWNAQNGEHLMALEGHTDIVSSIVFSPNAFTIVSASREGIRFWRTRTGQGLKTIQGHTPHVFSVAFSPNGDSFVSGGLDRALRLWDMRTRQVQQLFEGYAYATAFSPDGIILASGALSPDPRRLLVQQSDAYTPVRLQDANTGKLLRELKAHKGLVYSIAFSPDGNTLASGSEDKVIHLWDTHSGENLNTFEGHTAEISSVEFSPNGKMLASGSFDRTVRLWDIRSGKNLHTLAHTQQVTSVAFSPNGITLASGGLDKTVRLWQSQTGETLQTLKGHTGPVLCLAFSPDGRVLASGSGNTLNNTDGNSIHLWNTHTGEILKTLNGHSALVTSVDFLPNGGGLASGSWDGTILLWDFTTPATWGEIKQMTPVGDSNHVLNFSSPASTPMPSETLLLPNYPNPFNPETWMPYQLEKPSEVVLKIYDANGQSIRTLKVGYQPAGMYRSRDRAAYWDGRNQRGETVANGVYFFTLTAGDFTATRKMLVSK